MFKFLNKNLNKVYKFSGYIAALFLILVAVFILIGISSRIFNFYIRDYQSILDTVWQPHLFSLYLTLLLRVDTLE